MRVGIVGAAGTGKTTLAAALGKALGVPVIDDLTFKALEEEVGRPTWSGLRDTRIRRAVRLRAIDMKKAAETAARSFVSDKTLVDYAAYWLNNQAEFETLDQTLEALEICRAHTAACYDVCVFLPYRAEIDFSEQRSSDPIHNLRLSVLKRGVLAVFGARVVEAPYTFGEDIDAWIERWLAPALAAAPAASKPGAKGKGARAKGKAGAKQAKGKAGAKATKPKRR